MCFLMIPLTTFINLYLTHRNYFYEPLAHPTHRNAGAETGRNQQKHHQLPGKAQYQVNS